MKKHVNKIRLAVLVLAVMAMVLGVSMTVSASTTQTVTKAGYLRDEPNRGGIALVRIPKGATVTVGISQGKYSSRLVLHSISQRQWRRRIQNNQ